MFPDVFLSGNDLIKAGYKPGKVFTKILYELENLVIEGKIKSKKQALSWVEETFSKIR
jgi:tRNA nucleotidyltransferase/poly(A) polymerase